jgi:hypothetical protein
MHFGIAALPTSHVPVNNSTQWGSANILGKLERP